MIQQLYEFTDEEKMALLRLSGDKQIMQAITKMLLIREQSAFENMAQALEVQDSKEALRWAGYRQGVEDFLTAMKEVTIPMKERIAGTEPA